MANEANASGVTWVPRGVTWIMRGVTWAVAAALLSAGTLPVLADESNPTEQQGGELRLLESDWEDASEIGVAEAIYESVTFDPEIAEEEVVDLIGEADGELTQATQALQTAPVDTFNEAVANYQLGAALDDAGEALEAAEAVLAAPGEASDAALEAVDAALVDAIDVADEKLDQAIEGAPDSVVAQLEATDDALNDAAAAIAEVENADNTWIADLSGWVPNLRYAIDRRGPKRQLSGEGIDIALIDSGVTPVQGLDGSDKIINGPDLSGDSQNPDLVNLDLYGHGTHMAGIIAGNDGGEPVSGVAHFTGIAPDARIVNLKVADGEGRTEMESVVAAIEWAIIHKNDNGMNIRVIALALGHDHDDYMSDPISAALEEAWANGIVVVVAGGNNGIASGGLDAPAIDPYVISVAGSDQHEPTDRWDDTVAAWSSSGNSWVRRPDITAPGKSIVSLRVPGSHADLNHPESRIGNRFAVASGTSQATAVTAGTVALLLEKFPQLTPDQVKNLLMDGAKSIEPGMDRDGEGRIRLNKALWRTKAKKAGAAVQQFHPRAEVPEGFGTLNNGGWNGGTWSGATWSGATWSGATWSGATWSGATWSGATWSGATWSGATWSGATWSGATWSGATWSGATWSGATWSGATWS